MDDEKHKYELAIESIQESSKELKALDGEILPPHKERKSVYDELQRRGIVQKRHVHENSIKNLKPAKKGEIRNPNGRPKGGRNRMSIVRDAIECIMFGQDQSVVDRMTAAIIERAIQGDVPAYRELMDSAYGKITDKSEVDIKANINSDVTKQVLNAIPTEQLEALLVGQPDDND